MAEKRALSPEREGYVEDADESQALVVSKKQKTGQEMIVGTITKEGIKRTSNLQAPTMKLTGHGGEVYSLDFSPDGQTFASASYDKSVFLWRVYGDCDNYCVLKGHKNAVLKAHWFPSGDQLVSCSADKTIRAWDAYSAQQIKKYTEHSAVINDVCPMHRGVPMVCSGSDDKTVKLWDLRHKRSTVTLKDQWQVTAVAFSDAGDQIYSGGLDNTIKVWDLRKGQVAMTLKGHSHTVTSLVLSPDGTHLLSNSMDNTLRIWDMRPYAPANRCLHTLVGHMHSFEQLLIGCCWSADGKRVASGSSDGQVYVWETATRRIQYKLPGHAGSVNDVQFHRTEPIIASAGSDKNIFLGELME